MTTIKSLALSRVGRHSLQPSMWRIHMEGHVRGTFCGMVPDTWLNDQNLYICHHCSSLVAISHNSSHIKKCLKCPPSPESPVATPLTNASGDDLPSLRDICNLKCPTIRFIPNKAKPALARVLSAALRAVITENSIGSWIKLFMLPKCVLPCSKRRGRHNKPIPLEVLCDMWTDGHFGDLWSRAVKHATCTLHPKVDPGRRKVASAIHWLRMVSSERPANSSHLLELHPIMMALGIYSSVSTPVVLAQPFPSHQTEILHFHLI